jgi:hypothetical protein
VAERVVVAFASEKEGEFWLGAQLRLRGSSSCTFHEVEWYNLVDDAYSLWDDGLDLVPSERLLVSNVVLVAMSEGSERFTIAASSKATIAKAVADRRGRAEAWFTCVDEHIACALCGEEGEDLDDGVICDTCDDLYHRE